MCPIFEYQCTRCEMVFEKIEPSDAPIVNQCENCLSDAVRIVSSGGFVLNGDGFYRPSRKDYQPD